MIWRYADREEAWLMSRVGLDDATWRTLAALLLACTGIIALVLVLVTLRRLRVRVRDPVKLAYLAYCKKLRARGLPAEPTEGPFSYAERVSRARPDLEPAVSRFSRLYVALRYEEEPGAEVGRLQQLAREFKP